MNKFFVRREKFLVKSNSFVNPKQIFKGMRTVNVQAFIQKFWELSTLATRLSKLLAAFQKSRYLKVKIDLNFLRLKQTNCFPSQQLLLFSLYSSVCSQNSMGKTEKIVRRRVIFHWKTTQSKLFSCLIDFCFSGTRKMYAWKHFNSSHQNWDKK